MSRSVKTRIRELPGRVWGGVRRSAAAWLRQLWAERARLSVALVLFAGYLLLLLLTVDNLGYARDEGFYADAAKHYGRWFELFARDPEQALMQAQVDRYWSHNHEHPALMKTLFWLSSEYLRGLPLLDELGTSYRFPGMALSALAVSVVFVWGQRAIGFGAGLVAALSFGMMPRVFYHAHLDCFDMPVAAMWLFVCYAYWRSWERGGFWWPLFAALLYGLLLNTKHNSWLLPGALVLHFLLARGLKLKRDLAAGRFAIPLALPLMLTLGPLVFYLTWPWIWFDTGDRLVEYVKFHTQHVYYNMEFLGKTYFKPPMPRLYAPVMTLATVPLITLLLSAIGAWVWLHQGAWDPLRRALLGAYGRLRRVVTTPPARVPSTPEQRSAWSVRCLWAVSILTSYGPWLLAGTPIFGGTKHWITAYPFICLFAGLGFRAALAGLKAALADRLGRSRPRHVALAGALVACVTLGPLAMAVGSHPWGLSAYTPLVGGAPGGASLGLNRSFWGYTTGAIQEFINEEAPKRSKVFVHDTAMQSWDLMQKDGRLRKDLRGWWTVHGSRVALYHHEQHMSRVEFMTWVDYGTQRPVHIGAHDGVPVIWTYFRPKDAAAVFP